MDRNRSRYRAIPLPDDHPLDPGGSVTVERVRELSATEIAELLRDRTRVPRFVVADPGLPPHWVPVEQTNAFWQREVQSRVADPTARRWYREDFPGRYFYRASEWRTESGGVVVLLDRQH
jgi:hypothetical protein